MTDKEFIESMATMDSMLDHDPEVCGICYKNKLLADIAREMIAAQRYNIHEFCEEEQRRWRESKFYKLWQEEVAAGRDPHKAFKDRGWEP